jgi:predicted nucleic acid-binding protein
MSFLLDTNVISELVASKPNPAVIGWLEGLEQESVFLSVITIGELKRGIEKLSDSKRKRTLSDWLMGDLLIRFGNQVLPIDVSVILRWGTFVANMEAIGKPIPAIDSLLAATAAQFGLTFITRNVHHFEDAGISIFNPWELN